MKLLLALALLLFSQITACLAAEPARAAHAMVVTEQHYATQAGVEVLRHGGNAVDAAIAVAYALAVVDPCCGNIGGGGFMLIRMHDGRERFIDFREKAPLRATATMYQDAAGNLIPNLSTKGYLAVGVPGTVMGLERARTEYATMSREALMRPAIELAQSGYRLEQGDLLVFGGAASEGYSGAGGLAEEPNVRRIFFPNGRDLRAGDVLRQPQLAATLRRIAAGGNTAFYRGSVARDVVHASDAHHGILTMKDFASYTVREAAPLHCNYRGYDIASLPPPSSGGVVLCETLNILSGFPLGDWKWNSLQSTHYTVEAERIAYADRNNYLGDPDFVRNPVSQLIDPAYAARRRSTIRPDVATPSVQVHPGLDVRENNDTTHFSIVDKDGNAVALTFTINDWFGAGVIAGETGFFLNDEMDDFSAKPGAANMYGLVQGQANAIAPGKRPLSSMTPTIVTKGAKLFMVTGSPGGSRIPTIAMQTFQDVVDYGMDVQQAVDAPRVHMQWLPDEIQYEPGAFSVDVVRGLASMHYHLHEISGWGSAQAIVVDPVSGILFGGTDRRRPAGLAAGY